MRGFATILRIRACIWSGSGCDERAWSVRVTREYRAVARRGADEWVWVWIGSHQEFDRQFPS